MQKAINKLRKYKTEHMLVVYPNGEYKDITRGRHRKYATISLNDMPHTPFVLMHNHPSGNAEPSGADDDTTACIRNNFPMTDHLIVGETVFSYKDSGRLESIREKDKTWRAQEYEKLTKRG